MAIKNSSEQHAEGQMLRETRRLLFTGYCSHIAKMHATMLFEHGGTAFAE